MGVGFCGLRVNWGGDVFLLWWVGDLEWRYFGVGVVLFVFLFFVWCWLIGVVIVKLFR